MANKTQLFDLGGRTALITGSSQGIGLALARGLLESGASVVINGRDEAKLARAAEGLGGAAAGVHTAAFDVTNAAEVNKAIERVEAGIAPIDILINNAGITRRAPLLEMTDLQWHEVLDTNLTSAFLVSRAVAPRMISRKAGKVINICSLMSELGRSTVGNYAAAKGGLKMLTRSMAVEWAKFNVQVNGIGPGYFMTELTKPLVDNAEFTKWLCARTPAGRWGQPEELVGAAVFLASRASDFVNGQIVFVDGGVLAAL
ncbi:MAG TPA: SDR family oxidoreductase [Opitutaceae bacterium]